MGILTDFVIARADEGPAIGEAISPAEHWPTMQCKGVDMLKVGTLYCAIVGEPYTSEVGESLAMVGGESGRRPLGIPIAV